MLTNRQVMQIKRQIGYKHGFLPEAVDIVDISNIKKSIVIVGSRVEVEVQFSHKSGYWGSEIFTFDPSDMRKGPIRRESNG